MRETRMSSAVGLVAIVLALAAFHQAPLSLTGTVRDAVTGVPLGGTAVRLASAGSIQVNDPRIQIADKDGRYRFTAVEPGRYEVSARLDGYLDGRFGQARPGAPGRLVEINASAAVADMVLWQGAVITGTVYGSDGRPRSGLEVASMKRGVEFGQPRLVPSGRPVRTNDRGEYRIFGLEPGRYYLLATPPIGGAAMFGTESDSYTYAPGVTDPQEALAVDAVGGADAVVHMTLQRRRVHTISGTVDQRLRAATGPTLVEFRLLSTRAVRIISASRDGSFEAKGLLPGRYKVTIGGPAARDAEGASAAVVIVEVTASDVSGVIVGPTAKATVRGRVVLRSGRTLTVAETDSVRIAVVPADRDAQPGPPTAAIINPDSTYALDVWPGPFVMRLVTRRTGWVITRVMQNGRDVTSGLDAGAGSDLNGVDIHITDTAPRLQGTVTDAPEGVGGCEVVAFATDEKLWKTGAGSIQTRTSAAGAFTISALAPGEYFIAAVASSETLEDPALLRQLRGNSARVRLSDGATTEVTLRCVPLPRLYAPSQTQ